MGTSPQGERKKHKKKPKGEILRLLGSSSSCTTLLIGVILPLRFLFQGTPREEQKVKY